MSILSNGERRKGLQELMTRLRRSAAKARRRGGIQRLQVDDWIALQTLIWSTLLVVSLNKIVFGGGKRVHASSQSCKQAS